MVINHENIDWKQLCTHKEVLVEIRTKSWDFEAEALSGIIHFLDHLQDLAADQIGEEKV